MSTDSAVTIVGVQNQLLIQSHSHSTITYPYGSKQFIADIPKLLKNVKGVIVNVFEYTPSAGYAALFITAKLTVAAGDTVIVIIAFEDGILKTEYEFTATGYKRVNEDGYPVDIKASPKTIREKIYGPSPKKTILVTDAPGNPIMKFLRTTLKSKKLIVFDKHPSTISNGYICEMAKWLFDRSFVKYHIVASCKRGFFMSTKMNENDVYSFIHVEKGDALPFTQTAHHSNTYDKMFYGYDDDQQNCKTMPMSRKCYLIKVTLTIDAENFIDIKKEEIIYPEIESCLKKLDGNVLKKIPIIGMKDDLSVIYVYKNGKYQFLDGWNGMYGKTGLITFDGKKPKFCDNAIPAISEKPTSGVYGLIKIMAMPEDKVEIEKKQQFSIIKNAENPVLLEFDDFDGNKSAASPAFLMAMLLRQHLKSIQAEFCGEKSTQIGIALFNKFTDDQRQRVEKKLKEACELFFNFILIYFTPED